MQEPDENKFPDMFRTIEDKDYSVKLFVIQANTDKLSRTYLANDIYERSLLVHSEEMNVSCEIHNYTDSPNDVSFYIIMFSKFLTFTVFYILFM